jgi:hypothetical protein
MKLSATPALDRYLTQWRFYKNCLIVFLAINVFSVSLAFILAFYYYGSKRDIGVRQSQALAELQKADTAITEAQTLQMQLAQKKSWTLKTRADEEAALAGLAAWHRLSVAAQDLGLKLNIGSFTGLIASAESQQALNDYQAELAAHKGNLIAEMQKQLRGFDTLTRSLILTGLITLVFGIILPQFLIFKLAHTLNTIRIEMQNSAREFIKTWAETRAGFDDGAFKNVDFWLQIILLSTQHASRLSSHPALQVTSEMAYLLREELKKNSSRPAA